MKHLATFIALYLWASVASAAIYTYTLHDHPAGNAQANYDYGLRLDSENLFFTFQNGNLTLTYDDVLGTMQITGFANQSTPVDNTSLNDTPIFYELVAGDINDQGGGFFTATGGSGTVGPSADTPLVSLTGKGLMSGPNAGLTFLFLNDGHRLPGNPGTGIVGRGWIEGEDTNDFLFTATLNPVPVPAAVWLFGTALVGLIGFSKRRRAG